MAKLEIVMDDKEIRTEIKGDPVDLMLLAKSALDETQKALKKFPELTDKEALRLMDEVVESYRVEAHYGKESSTIRNIMQTIKFL